MVVLMAAPGTQVAFRGAYWQAPCPHPGCGGTCQGMQKVVTCPRCRRLAARIEGKLKAVIPFAGPAQVDPGDVLVTRYSAQVNELPVYWHVLNTYEGCDGGRCVVTSGFPGYQAQIAWQSVVGVVSMSDPDRVD